MMVLKSMRRASFRKSSFGFAISMYFCPSDALIVILRGLAIDLMMSTSSSISTIFSVVTLAAKEQHHQSKVDSEGTVEILIRKMRGMEE